MASGLHRHGPHEECLPACPGFASEALQLAHHQGRPDRALAACRSAQALESVVVAPGIPGVELPAHLAAEELVRLTLVVGRDTPAVQIDEWGIRANLTFRGRRHDCAFPWAAVVAGILVPPPAPTPPRRFQVIAGGKKD